MPVRRTSLQEGMSDMAYCTHMTHAIREKLAASRGRDDNPERLDLAEEVHALAKQIRRMNSANRRLYLGVLGGIGGIIGATIFAAPLIYLLSKLLGPFGVDVPGF